MASRILTVSELAEHLNVHRITIYRLLKSGTLPGFKIGRVWRFDLDEITSWMASGKSSTASALIAADGIAPGAPPHDAQPQHVGHSQDGPPKGVRAKTRPQPAKPSDRDKRGGKNSRI
jgi:excisionase family DNA binding protein